MKKMVIMMFVACVMFFVTGCGEDATPPMLTNAVNRTESELSSQYVKIDDDGFWNSAKLAANLVANGIVKNREYRIDITLETSEGSETLVEMIRSFSYMNESWRRLYRNQLLLAIASDEKVVEAHENGELIRVSGTVLTYFDTRSSGALQSVELRDLDGDGKWDSAKSGP